MTNKKIGKIIKLFISEENNSSRTNCNNIALDEKGVKNDKFYDKNNQRSVLITSLDSYQLINKNNIAINHGELGENLLIDCNPYSFKFGTKLTIGETILEISQNCTICNHLSKIDKTLPKLLKNDRGIFAKVIKNGTINLNDSIYID